MKFRKNLLALPVIAVVGMGAISVFGNNDNAVAIPLDMGSTLEVMEYEVVEQNLFAHVSGTVTDIFELGDTLVTNVVLETEEGRTYHFILSESTALIKDGEIVGLNEIAEGQTITAHYDNTMMIPAIYPARINASALVVSSNENQGSVHVDAFTKSEAFDGQLVSADGSLRFEVTEDTVVVDVNNEAYTGSLENKNLAVVFTASTRSIPAMAMNPKVVVLGDSASVDKDANTLELFSGRRGTVTSVDAGGESDFGVSLPTVILELVDGGVFHFVIEENTMIVKNGELVSLSDIEEGDEVNVQYEALQIAPSIYPPRLRASAIVISGEEDFSTTRVDVFMETGGQLISSDNSLRLEITDETVIVDVNNNVYTGSIENKKLGLIFSATTMSIPAVPINPIVVVLGEAQNVAGMHMFEQVENSDEGVGVEFFLENSTSNNSGRYTIELAD